MLFLAKQVNGLIKVVINLKVGIFQLMFPIMVCFKSDSILYVVGGLDINYLDKRKQVVFGLG